MEAVRGTATVELRRRGLRRTTDRFPTSWTCGVDPMLTSAGADEMPGGSQSASCSVDNGQVSALGGVSPCRLRHRRTSMKGAQPARNPPGPHCPAQRQLQCCGPVSGLASAGTLVRAPEGMRRFPGEAHQAVELPPAPRRPLRGQRRNCRDRKGVDAPASRLTRPSSDGRAAEAEPESVSGLLWPPRWPMRIDPASASMPQSALLRGAREQRAEMVNPNPRT
jgi:hypothetical protein